MASHVSLQPQTQHLALGFSGHRRGHPGARTRSAPEHPGFREALRPRHGETPGHRFGDNCVGRFAPHRVRWARGWALGPHG